MSVLSSLLARDQVVAVKKIEEAIQRQVISGGELPTVLLEVGAAPENVIAAYHAASIELLAASRDDVMNASPEVTGAITRAVAERHHVVPIDREGSVLVVASAYPVDGREREAIARAAGAEVVVVRIATEPRIAAGLQAHYGVNPIPRMRRLLSKLAAVDAGALPTVTTLLDNRRQSTLPGVGSSAPAAAPSWMRSSTAGVTEPLQAGENARASAPAGSGSNVRTGQEPAVRANAAVAVGVSRVVGVAAAPSEPSTTAYARGRAEPGEAAPTSSPPVANRPAVEATTTVERSVPPPSIEGTLDADAAVAALATADSRHAIFDVAFAHARTHFDYCALFSAHDEEAEGLDAFGDGATAEDVRAITIDLQRPSVARDVKQHVVAKAGVLDATDADRELVTRLGRAAKQPAVLVPVAIRQRLVLLLYGDRGGRPLGVGDVADLIAFMPRVSEALQRLILQRRSDRKLAGIGSSSQPAAKGWLKTAGAEPAEEERASDPDALAEAQPVVEVQPVTEAPVAAEAPAEPAPSEPLSPEPEPALARSRLAEIELASAVTQTAIPAVVVHRAEPIRPAPVSEPLSERPRAFDLLGVPRKAPLPPELTGAGGTPTPAEPLAASRASLRPQRPPEDTTYRGAAVEEEVVLTRRKRRSSRPSAAPSGPIVQPSIPPHALVPVMPKAPVDDDEPEIEISEAEPAPLSDATIITELGLDLDDIVDDLVRAERADIDSHVERLVAFGEPALRVLARRFPGPLWIDARPPSEGPHPRARDVSSVLYAMAAFRQLAVAHVANLLDQRDADVRYYASLLAAEISHRDLVVRIGRRVLDDDAGVRAVAVQALRAAKRYEAELMEVLTHFRRVGGNDRAPIALRRLAIELLGELRDGEAVAMLIDTLGDADHELAAHARKALVRITKQDFGASTAAWQPWLAERGDAHRIEWLIDALLHDDEAVRRETGDELKALTKEFFGFQAGLPRKERELVQRKYRKWWDAIGRARFVRG